MSTTFQGHRVSNEWGIILNAAAKDVSFRLNSGQRTLAEQAALVRQLGLYNSQTNPHGAAYPNPSAPHIKDGHVNHAIDVDSWNNGENRLQAWLAARGLHAINNVSTEAWHLDPVNEAELKALAKRLSGPPPIKFGTRGNKQLKLKRDLVKLGYLGSYHVGPFGAPAVAALKRFQKAKGLTADGQAGPLTLAAVARAIKLHKAVKK